MKELDYKERTITLLKSQIENLESQNGMLDQARVRVEDTKTKMEVEKDELINQLISEKCEIEQRYQDTRMLLTNVEGF